MRAKWMGCCCPAGRIFRAEFLRQPVAEPDVIKDPEPSRDAWEFAALRAALASGAAGARHLQGPSSAQRRARRHAASRHPRPRRAGERLQNIQPLRFAANATHRFANVNSSHHQAIDRMGDGLEIEAWCAGDEVIEQVRLRDYPWCLGVQYHPERDSLYAPLFEDFFAQLGS